VSTDAALVGAAAGALATAILVVNNLRDLETDRRTGKRTLAVILGYRGSRLEFLGLLGVAYTVPVLLWGQGDGPLVLAPLVTLPFAAAVAQTVLSRASGDALNPALERTGQLLALYALTLTVGLAAPEVV
jgi:1,4-dihydroxy-2-naphthoate octaprenyltransferase